MTDQEWNLKIRTWGQEIYKYGQLIRYIDPEMDYETWQNEMAPIYRTFRDWDHQLATWEGELKDGNSSH